MASAPPTARDVFRQVPGLFTRVIEGFKAKPYLSTAVLLTGTNVFFSAISMGVPWHKLNMSYSSGASSINFEIYTSLSDISMCSGSAYTDCQATPQSCDASYVNKYGCAVTRLHNVADAASYITNAGGVALAFTLFAFFAGLLNLDTITSARSRKHTVFFTDSAWSSSKNYAMITQAVVGFFHMIAFACFAGVMNSKQDNSLVARVFARQTNSSGFDFSGAFYGGFGLSVLNWLFNLICLAIVYMQYDEISRTGPEGPGSENTTVIVANAYSLAEKKNSSSVPPLAAVAPNVFKTSTSSGSSDANAEPSNLNNNLPGSVNV